MAVPKFDPREMKVIKELPASLFMPAIKIYNQPVSDREAVKGLMKKEPVWQVASMLENRLLSPRIIPDNVARSFVIEAVPFDPNKGGGPDMFGMIWEYVPVAGGSMIRPGKPFIEDFNEWPDKIVWPDIETWDWKGSAEENASYLDDQKFNTCWFMTGWFERLITFMEFENAAVAMIDEDQQEAIKAFFDRATDLYMKIFDKFCAHFPAIDGFCIHDDWGSQQETFFSPAVAAEMIVPYMKRVTDFLHAKGKYCELHSCGRLMKQVPNIIAAGWDSWCGQAMNDTQKIYNMYGDAILLGVMPDLFDPEALTEEEQREEARKYAAGFCNPRKPSFYNFNALYLLTPAFREELYRQSRIRYSR
ncbi:MAG TPA: methyltransferase [Acidobacteriota bacterium]|nr:methyltransferase [Acidobacteriota bacterium]